MGDVFDNAGVQETEDAEIAQMQAQMQAPANATATTLHDDIMSPINNGITELTGVTSRNVPVAGGVLSSVEQALVKPIDAAVTGVTQSIAGRRKVLGDDADADADAEEPQQDADAQQLLDNEFPSNSSDADAQEEDPQQIIDDVFAKSGVQETEDAEIAQMEAQMQANANAPATTLHNDIMSPINNGITELTGVTSRNVPVAGGMLSGVEQALVKPVDAPVTGVTQSLAGRRKSQ